DLRADVVEQLGDQQGVLVIDETGFLKKGTKSVGVQRQYSGTAGRIENCQLGVFLAYASPQGRTFLDRELYLPKEWAADDARRAEAAVPLEVEFQTKPQLARVMLERAREASVPAAWGTGDEVYGGDRRLRVWLEERHLAHVLAIKRTEPLWSTHTWREVAAATLAAEVPAEQWERRSAGEGAKGPRVYDWTRVPMRPLREPGWEYWLLVRRSLSDPTDLAYYVCFSPQGTPLAELVREAGTRWAIEEGFESTKGEVGLDQYEVRRWTGWYRHITLALLAHAYLTVTRAVAERGALGCGPAAANRAGGAQAALATRLADRPGARGDPCLVAMAPTPPAAGQTLPLPHALGPPYTGTTAVVLVLRSSKAVHETTAVVARGGSWASPDPVLGPAVELVGGDLSGALDLRVVGEGLAGERFLAE